MKNCQVIFSQPLSTSSELFVDRVWDGVRWMVIRYRSDCIGDRLPTIKPQTILYTLPSSRLVYKCTPIPAAVVELDLSQNSPAGERGPQNLYRESNPRPPKWASSTSPLEHRSRVQATNFLVNAENVFSCARLSLIPGRMLHGVTNLSR